jgi:ubiquitin-conjugating enzyme E2 variant
MDELAPRLGSLGERLSAEFRDHHVRPDVCREASAWTSAFAGSLVVLPLAVGTVLLHHGNRVPTFIALVLAVLLVTPEIHKWSHGARGVRLVAPLQRAGLLISPAAHAAHHRSDGSAYCVVTGWWNPLLDGLGFWRVMARRGLPRTNSRRR